MTPEELPVTNFRDERNDMAYWWPILDEVDVMKPETYRVGFEGLDLENKRVLFDEEKANRVVTGWGGDAFVRGGYKSAMHDMERGSIIRSVHDVHDTLEELLFQHVQMQLLVGDYFWFRELLDLDFCYHCEGTLHPECRAFIRDGEVICHHPRLQYDFEWAPDHHREVAIGDVENGWNPVVPECEDWEPQDLSEMARRVADAFADEGAWSVDFVMDTEGYWYCTDMALDGLYEASEVYPEREGLCRISDHPGDCEHDWYNMLDEEYQWAPDEPEDPTEITEKYMADLEASLEES